jgi:hypothetical protein
MPLKPVSRSLMATTPYPPVTPQNIRQRASPFPWKERSQGGEADGRTADSVQELDHWPPSVDGDTARWTASQLGLVLREVSPEAKGAFRDVQVVRHRLIGCMTSATLRCLGHPASEVLFRFPASRLATISKAGAWIARLIDRVGCSAKGPDRVRTGVRTGRGRGF